MQLNSIQPHLQSRLIIMSVRDHFYFIIVDGP